MESRAAFSAACRKCGQYWRVQDLLNPVAKAAAHIPTQRRVRCFDCAAEFDAPSSAQSTMCKKCSSYIDLHDYTINNAVSKNFKTKGNFVIEPAGYVFNSETMASEVTIKGRFIGRLTAEQSLTLYSTAQIKGSFTAAQLIIPAGNQFRWAGEIKVGSAVIEGELVADLRARDVHVKSTGHLYGTVRAQSLLIDPSAVVIVNARIEAA